MKGFIPFAVLLVMLSACGALELTSPKGFDQQLAAAYGTHTAVTLATTQALQAGLISSAEATSVQTQITTSRAMLDTAKSLEGSNITSAQGDLTLATNVMSAVQTFLNGRH